MVGLQTPAAQSDILIPYVFCVPPQNYYPVFFYWCSDWPRVQTVECVLNELSEVFDYAYVMGASATAYLSVLRAEIEVTVWNCPSKSKS